jgi:hypothetical protein
MNPHDIYVTNQLQNPEAVWSTRIVCLEASEKGVKVIRPSSGETFFMSREALSNSFWVPFVHTPEYAI